MKGATVSDDNKLNANDTLSKVLAYVDSPFKLFALVLMAVLTFAGYFVYENKDLLVGAYKENQRMPSINEERADEAAQVLFKHLGAASVVIFKVNPLFGTRTAYRAYTKDGRNKSLEGIDVGLFTQNSANNSDVVKLMAGEVPCGDYTKPQSEIGLWYTEVGVAFGCRISVPPDQSRFIGQITVGFKDRPESVEDAQLILTIASTMLTKKAQ